MAKNEIAAPGSAERKIQPVKISNVKIDAGQYRRNVVVRLPAGITAQDIHDYPNELFRLVQESPVSALARFDSVLLIADDETWCIDGAIVTDAGPTSVSLSFKSIITMPTRSASFEDEKYRVFFDGGDGFVVDRKLDGVRMLKGFQTLDSAKSEMFKALYPKRAA